MSEKGANTKGQNVYLWKNANGTYEYVPASGSDGAGGCGGSGGESINIFYSIY